MATKMDKTGADKSNQKENQQAGMEAISAIDLLEEDHREVEVFFEEYEELQAGAEKEQLALKICLALQVHAQLEEEIFYPAAREAINQAELINEAIAEHAAAKQLIAEIEGMDASDELYDAKVKVLGEQVSHHIEEEEDELFPQVKSSELDLVALGKKMAERKAMLFQQVADEGEPS
jgi:hemerythrin superfamily protein